MNNSDVMVNIRLNPTSLAKMKGVLGKDINFGSKIGFFFLPIFTCGFL